MNAPDDSGWERDVRGVYEAPLANERAARERLAARLAREAPPGRVNLIAGLGAWFASGSLEVRPLAALLTLALVALAGAWVGHAFTPVGRGARPTPGASATADPPATRVAFVLDAPGASTVAVVGDFNDWNPRATLLSPSPAGSRWAAQVALEPGLHSYAFIIDGRQWAPDPSTASSAEQSFGQPHSVLLVGSGGAL